MKARWGIVIGGLGIILVAGLLFLASRPPRGEAIRLLPAPSPVALRVHVTGAVNNPGVYDLPASSRVGDAIEAAGGWSQDANEVALNLAKELQDGDQVRVPTVLEGEDDSIPQNDPSRFSSIEDPATIPDQIVNINTASSEELQTLPGIGPVTAEKIIAYRLENGDFEKIEDIQKVYGIGPAKYEAIKDLITIEALP
jgi:competence protein ComEA